MSLSCRISVLVVGLFIVMATNCHSTDKILSLNGYRQKATLGDAEAQAYLGKLYLTGEGSLIQDIKKALFWFSKSAEQGDWFSQLTLGDMYFYGVGVHQDYHEALRWYLKAADQGIIKAEYNVAEMYRRGEGEEIDLRLALKWYQRSAEQDFASAQYQLGNMYYDGQGVIENHIKAYVWFSIASRERQESSDQKIQKQALAAKKSLATMMTPKQLLRAEKETASMIGKLKKRKNICPLDELEGKNKNSLHSKIPAGRNGMGSVPVSNVVQVPVESMARSKANQPLE